MEKKQTAGVLSVAFAYVCWGVLTVFWNLLGAVDSMYILAQRIVWSMVFMGVYMVLAGTWQEIVAALKSPRTLAICFICGVLITINWGVYIYAVNSGHVLDASMGYFVEPILVAVIGVLAFRERLSTPEKVTFVFSTAGLAYMIVSTRTFPSMALLIAGSFAIYGAVKKKLKLSPQASLFTETLCMAGFALIYIVYADMHGTGSIGVLHGQEFWLLPACGVVTSVPLLMFNIGVKKIPYYISGILMYINPTLQFLMGLFYFHEPLDRNRLIAFAAIWIGILFTVWERVQMIRKNEHLLPE